MNKIVLILATIFFLFTVSCAKQESFDCREISTNSDANSTILNSVPPYKVSTYWSKLRQIKIASESMGETEFFEYMGTYFSDERLNGMITLSKTKEMIAEIENSYVVILDKKFEDGELSFVVDHHYIFYQMVLENNLGIKFRIYTLPEKERIYQVSDNLEHIGTYTLEEATIDLFESLKDESDSVYGNIAIDGQYITFTTTQGFNLELFETVLPRLSFIEAKKLLNEIDVEAIQTEINHETTQAETTVTEYSETSGISEQA